MREKIGRLFMVGFDGATLPDSLRELIENYFVGGVILYRRNIESKGQVKELIASIRGAAKGSPMLVAVDHEGGRVFRLPPPFTQWGAMATFHDSEAVYKMGRVMAEELKEVGFNVNFAPVMDVNTNIKNPIIGDRSFSSDPMVVSSLGCALIRGLQDGGVIACGKHFPGHGDTSSDSHLTLPKLPHTLGRLEALELVPFSAAISEGVASIMTAHVVYEGIDKDLPATLSSTIINRILRRGLGYDGVVFTDDLKMNAIAEYMPIERACVVSLQAGCDVCLISRDNAVQRASLEYVIGKVSAGELKESVIDTAYRRVTHLKNTPIPLATTAKDGTLSSNPLYFA